MKYLTNHFCQLPIPAKPCPRPIRFHYAFPQTAFQLDNETITQSYFRSQNRSIQSECVLGGTCCLTASKPVFCCLFVFKL